MNKSVVVRLTPEGQHEIQIEVSILQCHLRFLMLLQQQP